ncbi:MAG: glycosyltransferase family 39 protein [Candidatus Daviesbacteria bacterium]|nr:glycosyltransferase family 39 protein [Candidatus Daviesbacteria bacterium]
MKILKDHFSLSTALLIFILLLGLFFRIYKLEIFYPFGHDQDLFAWVAKDIVADHHFRLIGQETSVNGVFIGPIFYYLIAICFALFNMDPMSANIPTTIFSLLTIFSIYFVFSKFFNKTIGLVGAFIYAVSPGIVFLDRWVVPTQPTILWTTWYLYILFSLLKGKIKTLIPLSILLGLIWHVHIAFIPLLALLPLSFLLSPKENREIKVSLKDIIISGLILFSLLLPLVTFEVRHNFQQVKGLLNATQEDRGDVKGFERLIKTFDATGKSLSGMFVLNNNALNLSLNVTVLLPIILLIYILYSGYIKVLTRNQTIILISWMGITLLSQFLSKRSISEYYLNNLFIIFILVLSIFLFKINSIFKKLPLALVICGIYLLIVTSWLINRPDDPGGYLQKRLTIEYIRNDALLNNYPCIGINYIEGNKGFPNGFRYLFWHNGLNLVTPGGDVPVYDIVTPWTISEKEVSVKFGMFGVILPHNNISNKNICTDKDRQLLPLWGFTN